MKKILCEHCEARNARSIDYINDSEGWKFACNSCGINSCSEYWVDFSRLDEPDWLTHLSKKCWFSLWSTQFERKFKIAKEFLYEKSKKRR